MSNYLDFSFKCPKCKLENDAEISYKQLKRMYDREDEIICECSNCSRECGITKSFFNKLINKLPEYKKIKILNYLSNGLHSHNLTSEADVEDAETMCTDEKDVYDAKKRAPFFLNILWVFLAILIFFLSFLSFPDFYEGNFNLTTDDLNELFNWSVNNSIFELDERNPYMDACLAVANARDDFPVTEFQIETCEMVGDELIVVHTTYGG